MSDLTGFLVVAPSCVGVNEPFSLRIKALTEPYRVDWRCYTTIPRLAGPFNLSPRGIAYMDNVPPDWTGRVIIEAEGYEGAPELILIANRAHFQVISVPLVASKIAVLLVQAQNSSQYAIRNRAFQAKVMLLL